MVPPGPDRPALTVVWDERFLAYDLGIDHPFSERSRGLAAELLQAATADAPSARIEWIRQVAPASHALLETFHRPEYVAYVETASGYENPILLDTGDTPSFPGCFEEAARLVEGADRALRAIEAHAHPAFHPAGGLHHAHPDHASGFCIFNDVAIAVGRAVRQGHRVAYLDIDAHHGDGVMYGFYDSGRVLDIDIHQDGRTLFPGTGFPQESGTGDGSGLKVNLPLPPLSGDEAIVPLFRRVVPTMLRKFRPDLIVLQHGVDGHAGDALAHLQYTPSAYAEIDRIVIELAHELCRGRVLVTGGGGYRASSVSRVLARAGLLFAGLPLPAEAALLPDGWRERYRSTIGELAPKAWEDGVTPTGSRWRPEHEAKLIAELERSLGEKFPTADSG
ncbi:MAG TPA: acetoin utilization protein AcuC [Thermoplasmata archaeon]|nr:acetoin utilization protein AcuC [Thermoplasmata archaeon]